MPGVSASPIARLVAARSLNSFGRAIISLTVGWELYARTESTFVLGAVGLVLLEIDAHRRAVVLAHGVDGLRVARVLQVILVGLEVRISLAVAEQEGDRIRADHLLRQRMRL